MSNLACVRWSSSLPLETNTRAQAAMFLSRGDLLRLAFLNVPMLMSNRIL